MFTNNALEKVQKRIDAKGVSDYIELMKGDVVNTLPAAEAKEAYLLVDDARLSGVTKAAHTFLYTHPSYQKTPLLFNFDYLHST
ncbi:MAG: hypothetical protein H7A36_06715 [Chlamydiales bacterium]|nr:hypothetical protein [Chlamydiales bacterium]